MAINFQHADVYVPSGFDRNGNATGYRIDQRDSMKATAGNAARAYQGAADNSMAGAVAAAQQGVGFAQQGIAALTSGPYGTGINTALEGLNKNYGLATGAATSAMQTANDVSRQAGVVSDTAQSVFNAASGMTGNIGDVELSASSLRPYASQVSQLADTLWNHGNSLFNLGNDIIGQGRALTNMDASAGGLIGEYVNWLNTIDPNRYVSMAASDVQSSYNNAQGQLNRQLTRAGSDASSTRTAAMQQQMAQSLAAALAGAKTRARMQGLSDQGKALQSALGQAQQMLTQGANIAKQGTDVEATAATKKSDAAGIEAKAGELYATAGDLRARQASAYNQAGQLHAESGKLTAQAGSLQTSAGHLYVEAGQLMHKYGDLSLGSAQALVSAYGNATNASNALAKMQAESGTYYAQVAQGYGSMAGDLLFGAQGIWGGKAQVANHW